MRVVITARSRSSKIKMQRAGPAPNNLIAQDRRILKMISGSGGRSIFSGRVSPHRRARLTHWRMRYIAFGENIHGWHLSRSDQKNAEPGHRSPSTKDKSVFESVLPCNFRSCIHSVKGSEIGMQAGFTG